MNTILQKLPTRIRNTLLRNGIGNPGELTLNELLRLPDLGLRGVTIIAEVLKKHGGKNV